MWFNVTYIIPNFYRTTLKRDHAIGPKLRDQKWELIWSFIFVYRMIINHAFIYDLIVVFNSLIIFAYIIFINLRHIYLTY